MSRLAYVLRKYALFLLALFHGQLARRYLVTFEGYADRDDWGRLAFVHFFPRRPWNHYIVTVVVDDQVHGDSTDNALLAWIMATATTGLTPGFRCIRHAA